MGEYAEMMLDGTCCAGCGEYLGEGDGMPVYCSACEPDAFRELRRTQAAGGREDPALVARREKRRRYRARRTARLRAARQAEAAVSS